MLFGKVSGEGELKDFVDMKASQVGLRMMKEEAESGNMPLTQNFIRQFHKVLQLSLWDDANHLSEHFKFAEKIPYKFSYKFLTDDGKWRTLMIEDWEIVELYRNCINGGDSEKAACQKVRDKYMKIANECDIFLFLGTVYKWQKMNGTNPFVIIGVFYPPKGTSQQLSLDF